MSLWAPSPLLKMRTCWLGLKLSRTFELAWYLSRVRPSEIGAAVKRSKDDEISTHVGVEGQVFFSIYLSPFSSFTRKLTLTIRVATPLDIGDLAGHWCEAQDGDEAEEDSAPPTASEIDHDIDKKFDKIFVRFVQNPNFFVKKSPDFERSDFKSSSTFLNIS